MYMELRIYQNKDPILYELYHLGYPLHKMCLHVLDCISRGMTCRIRLEGYRSIWCMRTIPPTLPPSIHIRIRISDKRLTDFYRGLTGYKRNQLFKQAMLSSLDPMPVCIYIDNDDARRRICDAMKGQPPSGHATLTVSAPETSQYAKAYNREAKVLMERYPLVENMDDYVIDFLTEDEQKEFVRCVRKLIPYKSSIDRLGLDPQGLLVMNDDVYSIYMSCYRGLYQEHKDDPDWYRLFRKPKLRLTSLVKIQEEEREEEENEDKTQVSEGGKKAAPVKKKKEATKRKPEQISDVSPAPGKKETLPAEKEETNDTDREGEGGTLPSDIQAVFSRIMTM